MDRLNRLLETRLMEWKAKESPVYRGQNYEVNYELIAAVHVPVFDEIERLYLDGLGKTATPAQRRRLEMFGENLVLLHHHMRHAGLIVDGKTSSFYRDDQTFQQSLTQTDFPFSIYRVGNAPLIPIWKGEYRGP
jgi:hypothetical protein